MDTLNTYFSTSPETYSIDWIKDHCHDYPNLENTFKNKVVLITGAAGSLGSEITRIVSHLNTKKMILIDIAESPLFYLQQELFQNHYHNFKAIVADIRNTDKINTLFIKYRPHIVIHAAAYKHVPLMESNPYQAVSTNVSGTITVVDLAIKHGVERFAFLSTDKAVKPTSVMGATKHIAELYIKSLEHLGKTKFATIRFGNVLGSNGSVVTLFERQLRTRTSLTVTHPESSRYFISLFQASLGVIEGLSLAERRDFFLLNMDKPIKIFDLALKFIEFHGYHYPEDIDIKIVGLRPGEKIREELISPFETALPTAYKTIKRILVPDIDQAQIKDLILDLNTCYSFCHNLDIVSKIKEIVPDYISNNSKFDLLDK